MTDNGGQWERELVSKLAAAALQEQRRARRWGIFFKLLTFAYITFLLVVFVDWQGRAEIAGGGKKHTAMVELNGTIAPGSDASAERVVAALQAAFKDRNTQGVVLRINSPGGSPVQSQVIYDEMRRLRKAHPDIPLYAVVEDICASGGYFVAAGADRIFVGKASIVGSIGVLMNGFGFTGLMEKLGVERRVYTAGERKAILDPFRPEKPDDVARIKALHSYDVPCVVALPASGGNADFLDWVRRTEPYAFDMLSALEWRGLRVLEVGCGAHGLIFYFGAKEAVGVDPALAFSGPGA